MRKLMKEEKTENRLPAWSGKTLSGKAVKPCSVVAGLALTIALFCTVAADACTGITLKSKDGTVVVARTIEWGGSNLNSQYVVVPRGYVGHLLMPDGGEEVPFTSRYGYAGLAVEQEEFIAEGVNEVGLSAGLFYFPGYGSYETYDTSQREQSVSDLQLVPWLLGQCATVDEVKDAVRHIHVILLDSRSSTAHWRFADESGRQVVLEIADGIPHFYENPLGVLTNSPGFEWQLTNLNNYLNLYPGAAPDRQLEGLQLSPFGAGSGFLGLPGDITPPSRFVRAAFYQAATPPQATAFQSVLQCFQLLNNFDIPIGIEFADGETPADIPSATQWTSVTDMKHRTIYYRTMYNSVIRCIDLRNIDFDKVNYQVHSLDSIRQQPVEAAYVEVDAL